MTYGRRALIGAIALSILPSMTPVAVGAQSVPDINQAFLDHLLDNGCVSTVGELIALRTELLTALGERMAKRLGDPRDAVLGFGASKVLTPGAYFIIGDGPTSIVNRNYILPEVPVHLMNNEGCP